METRKWRLKSEIRESLSLTKKQLCNSVCSVLTNQVMYIYFWSKLRMKYLRYRHTVQHFAQSCRQSMSHDAVAKVKNDPISATLPTILRVMMHRVSSLLEVPQTEVLCVLRSILLGWAVFSALCFVITNCVLLCAMTVSFPESFTLLLLQLSPRWDILLF